MVRKFFLLRAMAGLFRRALPLVIMDIEYQHLLQRKQKLEKRKAEVLAHNQIRHQDIQQKVTMFIRAMFPLGVILFDLAVGYEVLSVLAMKAGMPEKFAILGALIAVLGIITCEIFFGTLHDWKSNSKLSKIDWAIMFIAFGVAFTIPILSFSEMFEAFSTVRRGLTIPGSGTTMETVSFQDIKIKIMYPVMALSSAALHMAIFLKTRIILEAIAHVIGCRKVNKLILKIDEIEEGQKMMEKSIKESMARYKMEQLKIQYRFDLKKLSSPIKFSSAFMRLIDDMDNGPLSK